MLFKYLLIIVIVIFEFAKVVKIGIINVKEVLTGKDFGNENHHFLDTTEFSM